MRAAEHLQENVGPRRLADRDHTTCHVWIQAAEVLPFAVDLLPLSRAANFRLFEHASSCGDNSKLRPREAETTSFLRDRLHLP
jgi:hypothetical protein